MATIVSLVILWMFSGFVFATEVCWFKVGFVNGLGQGHPVYDLHQKSKHIGLEHLVYQTVNQITYFVFMKDSTLNTLF